MPYWPKLFPVFSQRDCVTSWQRNYLDNLPQMEALDTMPEAFYCPISVQQPWAIKLKLQFFSPSILNNNCEPVVNQKRLCKKIFGYNCITPSGWSAKFMMIWWDSLWVTCHMWSLPQFLTTVLKNVECLLHVYVWKLNSLPTLSHLNWNKRFCIKSLESVECV